MCWRFVTVVAMVEIPFWWFPYWLPWSRCKSFNCCGCHGDVFDTVLQWCKTAICPSPYVRQHIHLKYFSGYQHLLMHWLSGSLVRDPRYEQPQHQTMVQKFPWIQMKQPSGIYCWPRVTALWCLARIIIPPWVMTGSESLIHHSTSVLSYSSMDWAIHLLCAI
jgi:hypothetical protein